MLYAQLTHSIGLNDVCDALVGHHRGALSSIRGAEAPSRSGLSYANKHRDAKMAEELFWSLLSHLQSLSPGFAGRTFKGFPRRFKRTINVVDSTTIALIANCMYWAKHRRRKAAAKCHLRLDLQSFLPRFAIIDTAKENDAKRAREVCAGLKEGEIVLFDKAYVDFEHLFDLSSRGVYFVTRAMACRKRLINKPKGNLRGLFNHGRILSKLECTLYCYTHLHICSAWPHNLPIVPLNRNLSSIFSFFDFR